LSVDNDDAPLLEEVRECADLGDVEKPVRVDHDDGNIRTDEVGEGIRPRNLEEVCPALLKPP
jgi:hypothetical protein